MTVRRDKKFLILLPLMALGLLLASCTSPSVPADTETFVSLHFYSQEDLDTASGQASFVVKRMVAQDPYPLSLTALGLLFRGPNPTEEEEGARTTEDLENLEQYFNDVTIDGTTATVDFDAGALEILNSAAARQAMVKAAIGSTLGEMGIVEVKYSIDGEEFTEWDA